MNENRENIAGRIMQLCRRYEDCRVEGGRWEEGGQVKEELRRLCQVGKGMMSVSESGLLIALMEAYEVTRDEGMLQEVLDVVSGNLDRLEVSVESMKLLAYCYYYVEEEECAAKAREMLEELKREGKEVEEAVVEMLENGGEIENMM